LIQSTNAAHRYQGKKTINPETPGAEALGTKNTTTGRNTWLWSAENRPWSTNGIKKAVKPGHREKNQSTYIFPLARFTASKNPASFPLND